MILEVRDDRPPITDRNGVTSVPITSFSRASGSAKGCGIMKHFMQTHAVRLVIGEALEISSACRKVSDVEKERKTPRCLGLQYDHMTVRSS